jgi:hypothetical protein
MNKCKINPYGWPILQIDRGSIKNNLEVFGVSQNIILVTVIKFRQIT